MIENNLPAGTADREIVTTRLVDAPRDLVFEAWTNPAHLGKWWAPKGFTATTRSFDLRPHGTWVLTLCGPDGTASENEILYEEIVRPSRLVLVHEPAGFRATVAFAQENGKTRVVLHRVFRTAKDREAAVRKFHADDGAREMLERLADHLDGQRPSVGIERTFDAPRRAVWEAWTEAERVARWFTPRPLATARCVVDFRPGGVLRVVMRAPDGAEHAFEGTFGEITAPDSLAFHGKLPDGNDVRTVVTFAEQEGGKTKLTVRQTYAFESDATRGAPQGWKTTLEQLAEHVKAPARPSE